jgi:hypothetical protein
MHTKTFASVVVVIAIGAAGCSPEPKAGRSDLLQAEVPPPEISMELPLERDPPRKYPQARACLLSEADACTELDRRPFEPCLATDVSCEDKGSGGLMPLDKSWVERHAPPSR